MRHLKHSPSIEDVRRQYVSPAEDAHADVRDALIDLHYSRELYQRGFKHALSNLLESLRHEDLEMFTGRTFWAVQQYQNLVKKNDAYFEYTDGKNVFGYTEVAQREFYEQKSKETS